MLHGRAEPPATSSAPSACSWPVVAHSSLYSTALGSTSPPICCQPWRSSFAPTQVLPVLGRAMGRAMGRALPHSSRRAYALPPYLRSHMLMLCHMLMKRGRHLARQGPCTLPSAGPPRRRRCAAYAMPDGRRCEGNLFPHLGALCWQSVPNFSQDEAWRCAAQPASFVHGVGRTALQIHQLGQRPDFRDGVFR